MWSRALQDIPGEPGRVIAMITQEELAAYDALPDRVTVYRGCSYRRRGGGISWSLDVAVARRFAYFSGYGEYDLALVTATVRKENTFAVLLGGEAPEVLTFKVRRRDVFQLPSVYVGRTDLQD